MPEANEQAAVYAIHVEGELGPLLVASLSPSSRVRTEEPSVVIVSVTDDDLVDVAEKLARFGVEIGSVRQISADPP